MKYKATAVLSSLVGLVTGFFALHEAGVFEGLEARWMGLSVAQLIFQTLVMVAVGVIVYATIAGLVKPADAVKQGADFISATSGWTPEQAEQFMKRVPRQMGQTVASELGVSFPGRAPPAGQSNAARVNAAKKVKKTRRPKKKWQFWKKSSRAADASTLAAAPVPEGGAQAPAVGVQDLPEPVELERALRGHLASELRAWRPAVTLVLAATPAESRVRQVSGPITIPKAKPDWFAGAETRVDYNKRRLRRSLAIALLGVVAYLVAYLVNAFLL